ncbi:MAG: DUF3883 domain-containing protein [Proteobacteria bacterium]|nr:DUF3883 domain-containing protein [Pseudomonadota bacterium]
MPDRIAFVKTGWSEDYKGGPVAGRHTYISEFKEAHERFNFLKGPHNKYYAFLPPIGPKYRPPQPKNQNDWLVIFVSAKNGNGPLTVVGWYEDATFERDYQKRPEYKLKRDFETSIDGEEFIYCVSADLAQLIPMETRNIIVPSDHFKRTPIIYAKGNGKDDPWRQEFAKLATTIINNSKGSSPKTKFPDSKHRKAVEKAAVDKAIEFLEAKNYKITDRQKNNCGYDLLAKREKKPNELHVEVKGTSLKEQRFFISRNEMKYMPHPNWRLIIVTDALKRPKVSMLTQKQVQNKFKFDELSWEAVLK